MFKPAGTVTGLYREDYGYNATSAAFSAYCDIWRQIVGQLTTLSAANDGTYLERVGGKKKGVS